MLPIPLPWLIVGVMVSLFGTYQVGHHYGWLERDNDMKIAIAKKNEEARLIGSKAFKSLIRCFSIASDNNRLTSPVIRLGTFFFRPPVFGFFIPILKLENPA